MEFDSTIPAIRVKAQRALINPDYAQANKITFGLNYVTKKVEITSYGKMRQHVCFLTHWGCDGEATERDLFNQKICKNCYSKEML